MTSPATSDLLLRKLFWVFAPVTLKIASFGIQWMTDATSRFKQPQQLDGRYVRFVKMLQLIQLRSSLFPQYQFDAQRVEALLVYYYTFECDSIMLMVKLKVEMQAKQEDER